MAKTLIEYKLNSLLYKIKTLLFLLQKKGIKYFLNKIHFFIFYGTKNNLLVNALYLFKPYPSYIEIEITTNCNLKCKMCEHTYWNEPNKNMSFEEFKNIVDQFPKLKWIGLTGIGDSFLNEEFLKMLGYVKSKNIFIELYNSFYFINKDVAEKLIKIGVDKIFASIDGATKETYEKIRVGSDFERVINNVKDLVRLKKKKDSFFPEVAFHFVVIKDNFREIPEYIKMVHSVAGENTNIQFSKMLHEFEQVKNIFSDIPKEIKKSAEKKAGQLNMRLSWNADVSEKKSKMTKCTQWIMPFIFVTGEVIPCCSKNEANQRTFQKETSLGNIFEQNFKEIWNGKQYENFRKTLQKGGVPPQCENCCLYNINKNENRY